MAFIGVATVKEVSDSLVRITGLSLAEGASGTIALHESSVAPGVRLPAAFKPRKFTNPQGQSVELQDSIQVWYNYILPGPVEVPVKVVKTGTTPEDFLATLTNTDGLEAGGTGGLEIYVRFHKSS